MHKSIQQPTPEELGIINKHFAKVELKAEDLYSFDIEAADDYTRTSFFSYLGTDMIEAFHQDVMARHISQEAELIGFLFGHDTSKIPSGTLFQSELVQVVDGEAKLTSFRPSVYMAKDLKTAEISTDDYVKAYESGHTEAVSVGFQAGSFICGICGNDMRSFNCPHMPGHWYNVAPEGETPVMQLCTYTVHQGSVKKRNLIELSGVYAGAMPGKRVKGEFSLPENSNLEVKEGKVVDGQGGVFGSTSLKDFKETDVLRFNFQFDGSIEKVGETDMSSGEIKSILEKLNKLEGEKLVLETSLSDLQAKVDALQLLFDKVQADLVAVGMDLDKERIDHKATVKHLSLSEMEKQDLTQKLERTIQEIEELKVQLDENKTIADSYVRDLKAQCSKLSIQINGMNHNPEIFDKEIANLSVEDLKLKIDGLEKQLAQSIPIGKQTETKTMVVKERLNEGFNGNPELYKFK
jgi:hypothetical protein